MITILKGVIYLNNLKSLGIKGLESLVMTKYNLSLSGPWIFKEEKLIDE